MKNLINKLISCKLIYGLLVIMAVSVTIFITAKMYPNIELSRKEKVDIDYISLNQELADVQIERVEYTNITSRGGDIIREAKTEEQENIEEETQEETDTRNVSNTKNENKEDTTKYISIEDVKISKDMDLTVRTGLSRDDFIELIASVKYDTSGFFEENAGTIYDLCEEYSINEIFFCGLISAESGWNIASNHRKTHNYISLMSNGKLIQYSSVYEGLEVAAQKLHDNYLTPGGRYYNGKTLAGVKVKFCPSSSTWVDLVYGRMKQILY